MTTTAQTNDRHVVSGELSKHSVPDLLATSRDWFSSGPTVVDLSGVTKADSAAVALLLEWIRQAREAGHSVQYEGMPAPMQAIIELSGLDKLPEFSP